MRRFIGWLLEESARSERSLVGPDKGRMRRRSLLS